MKLNVRGREIRCYAKNGNKQYYQRMYEALSDERLDELAKESIEHEQASGKQEGTKIRAQVGEIHRASWLEETKTKTGEAT